MRQEDVLKSDGKEIKMSIEVESKMKEKAQKKLTKDVNFEKEKINEIVKKLAKETIKVSPQKVKKFIFKELDTELISKKIIKAISQVQELRRKTEEDTKKIWLD